jgi:hypothetical protein
MRTIGAVMLLAAWIIFLGVSDGQGGKTKIQPKGVSIHHVVPQGKVVERKSDAIVRFHTKIGTVPTFRPEARKGGNWHWHPWNGWVWLPIGVGPNAVLLEETYALPKVAVVYETAPAPMEVICPHCGKPITVYVH